LTFNDVLGHETEKSVISEMVLHERMPHALLITSQEGSGGLALALALAQMLQCEKPTTNGACGVCNACRKSAQFIHPDIHFSFPTVKKGAFGGVSTDYIKQWRSALAQNHYLSYQEWLMMIEAENKQGNIYKEECLAIIQKLSFKILEGKCKILLMWLPEYLGNEGNRLLKLIEEPPESTYFILVSENSASILPTIISRCLTVLLSPLNDDEVTQALIKLGNVDERTARNAAFISDGNISEGLLLVKNNNDNQSILFIDWLRKCYVGNAIDLTSWVDQFAQKGRETQKFFLQYALHFLRELLILVHNNNPSSVRLQPIEISTAQNIQKILTGENIGLMAQLFDKSIMHIERNANSKLLFLNISLQLHKILRNKNSNK
ncbi:MAG: hypothetical protein KA010_02540, partial [Saprospiraceae bacterium]|nr:hypothetical protein [Saprospiraceae bacterium]